MKELTPEVLREAVLLIELLRSGRLTDEELSEVALKLDATLLDPDWFSYTIDHEPELTPEEVVKRAFAYRPIQL